MTLVLSEDDVEGLIEMSEVVPAVEEAFRRLGKSQASNYMRTRSRAGGSLLNVMHANLAYLGRGGLKSYMVSKGGTKFVVLLFDSNDSSPLAVMGADTLGRFRTGAASGVATRHLYNRKSGVLALFGSGKQALTQAMALKTVMELDEVRVWSPDEKHRAAFADRLKHEGYYSRVCGSREEAIEGAQIATTITSSKEPFLTEKMVTGIDHLNLCGGNNPDHAEADSGVVGTFDTVVVDDISQAKVEYGDLILAEKAGRFSWNDAVDLGSVVSGKVKPRGRTMFKSGGAALEDVAIASLLYDKARKSGRRYTEVQLV